MEYYSHSFPILAEKSDIWSLGVLLFTLIVGCFPFKYSEKVIMSVGLDVIHDFISDQRCSLLLKELFSVDPNFRPSIAQIIDHPWLRY